MTESHTSAANGGTTLEECQRKIQESLKSPMVKFLRENLEKTGCPVGDNFIKAIDCEGTNAGSYYVPGEGVVVCSNRIKLQDEVSQAIRASHLTGECHYKRELLRGFLKIRGHEQECVRRRVMKSLADKMFCSGGVAKDSMEAVWDVCYNDTEPFDRAP